ncbi:MAG: hypothetical protein M1817_001569 [Caeruleum heppii]|nr:MAG: hypothetical protein M1817_001569 [Caeruleum heppii]
MLAIAGISQDPAQEQSLPDIKPPVMEVSAYNRDLDVTYNSIPLLAKKSWRNWSFFMTHYLKKRKLFFLIENDAKDRIEAESMYGSLNDNVLRRLRKETVSAIANKLPPDTQGEIGQIKDPKRLWDMAITKCLEEPARLSVEPLLAFLDWRWDYSAVDPMDNLAGIKRIHEDLKATYGSEIEVKFMIIQRLLTFLPTDFTRARDSCSGKRDVEFDEVEEAMRRRAPKDLRNALIATSSGIR